MGCKEATHGGFASFRIKSIPWCRRLRVLFAFLWFPVPSASLVPPRLDDKEYSTLMEMEVTCLHFHWWPLLVFQCKNLPLLRIQCLWHPRSPTLAMHVILPSQYVFRSLQHSMHCCPLYPMVGNKVMNGELFSLSQMSEVKIVNNSISVDFYHNKKKWRKKQKQRIQWGKTVGMISRNTVFKLALSIELSRPPGAE